MPDAQPKIGPLTAALLREIAELRRIHGVRQEDIAAAIGRTQPYVSARVNGTYPWSTVDLDRMAHLFGMDAWGLVASSRRWAGEASPSHTDPDYLSVGELEQLPGQVALDTNDDDDDRLHPDSPRPGVTPGPQEP